MPIANKEVTFALRVSKSEARIIRAEAKRRGLYVGELIRDGIERPARRAVSDARQMSLISMNVGPRPKRDVRLPARVTEALNRKAVVMGQSAVRISVLRKAGHA